jgi:hypothetical protein
MNDKLKWTDTRCTQLESLHRLVRLTRGLNHGSGIVDKIAECEAIADDLTAFHFDPPTTSFLDFINELAIADRTARKDHE